MLSKEDKQNVYKIKKLIREVKLDSSEGLRKE